MNLLEKITTLEADAAHFGFKWETSDQIMQQIESECLEIKEHLHQESTVRNQDDLQEEIGDLLHAVFSLCVFCNLDPKDTLEQTLSKFERRIQAVKLIAKEQGFSNLTGQSFDTLMAIWDKAKVAVG